MAKKELIVFDNPELQLIEESKALKIKKTFEPMVKMLEGFEKQCNQVFKQAEKVGIDAELTTIAKRIRLDIAQVRIQTDKLRKEQKEEYLRAGKAIDGASNILKWAVVEKENKLKEIETHFETQEKLRIETLQKERVEAIKEFLPDAGERDLAGMEEDVWQAYKTAKEKDHIDLMAAEKAAEEERQRLKKEDEAEKERIQAENDRLKKEAEEKERQLKLEEAKREAERQAEKERLEKIELEKKEQEEKAKKEQERLQAELDRKKREHEEHLENIRKNEQEESEEKERQLQAELNRGDEEKINLLKKDLEDLKTKYNFKSAKNKKTYKEIGLLLDKVINHIK